MSNTALTGWLYVDVSNTALTDWLYVDVSNTALTDSMLTCPTQHWATTGRRLIGSMSAASNVTGILSDVDSITVMLHTYGALALWDYATAGPYVRIDMNPVVSGYVLCPPKPTYVRHRG